MHNFLGEVESVEKEWEKFRDMVMKCTNDVCGMRRVEIGFREEIGLLMTDTRHREWL